MEFYFRNVFIRVTLLKIDGVPLGHFEQFEILMKNP